MSDLIIFDPVNELRSESLAQLRNFHHMREPTKV